MFRMALCNYTTLTDVADVWLATVRRRPDLTCSGDCAMPVTPLPGYVW
jgi:hypothetical protein